MEKKIVLQEIGVELLDIQMQRECSSTCITQHRQKLTQNGSMYLNVKPKTMKFIGENIRDLGLEKHFLGHQKHNHERKNWISSKLKISAVQKTKKRQDKLQIGRKYLQTFIW